MQDRTFATLSLSDYSAITQDGMIINVFAPYDVTLIEVKEAIDARITWDQEIAPILRTLDLNLKYQPGAFSGMELKSVIVNLKKDLAMIKSVTRKFNVFLVGKRFDFNLNTAALLMDSSLTGDKLKEKLLSLNPAVDDIDFQEIKTTMLSVMNSRGYHLEDILFDIPRTNESLNSLKVFTTEVVAKISVQLLQTLKVKVLHLNPNNFKFVSGTQVLFLTPKDTVKDVEKWLGDEIVNVAFLENKMIMDKQATDLGLELNLKTSFSRNLENVENFKGFNKWFFTVNMELKTTIKLAKIILLTERETNPTQFKSGVLTINFIDFSPEKMKDILVAPKP